MISNFDFQTKISEEWAGLVLPQPRCVAFIHVVSMTNCSIPFSSKKWKNSKLHCQIKEREAAEKKKEEENAAAEVISNPFAGSIGLLIRSLINANFDNMNQQSGFYFQKAAADQRAERKAAAEKLIAEKKEAVRFSNCDQSAIHEHSVEMISYKNDFNRCHLSAHAKIIWLFTLQEETARQQLVRAQVAAAEANAVSMVGGTHTWRFISVKYQILMLVFVGKEKEYG